MDDKLTIPKKSPRSSHETVTYNHQIRLGVEKTKRFARVREILGGYSSAELLEILIDKAIENYDDGEEPNKKYLPKGMK